MNTESPLQSTPGSGESGDGNRNPNYGETQNAISVPDHALLRCIGKGSYGEVWLARNIMGEHRAIKFVYRKSFKDSKPFDRELSGIRKFEPISRSHDGFVDVLHVGLNEAEGYFYYVMELGDDVQKGQEIDPANYSPKTLAKELSPADRLPVEDCLKLGLALTIALTELHKRGLVHRDIKPSNVIFINGTPKLADIGLVADVSEARSYVGTEGFIPPEGPGTPQGDIFALGKVLYEASTGRDRQDFPELPTNWDDSKQQHLLLELNEVILSACKSEISRRYQTAWDMHADLLVLANGKSVKRLKVLEGRVAKVKHLAMVAGPILLLIAGVSYHFYREWRMKVEVHQKQIGENIAFGTKAVEVADPSGALPYFAQALELDKSNPTRARVHRLRFGSTLSQCAKLEYMGFFTSNIPTVSLSSNGLNLLFVQRFGQARMIELSTGKTIVLPPEHLYWVTYNPDSSRIVTAGANGIAQIWDASNSSLLKTLTHINLPGKGPATVFSAVYSQDGLHVVTASKDGAARIWNPATGDLEYTLRDGTNALNYACFSHNGEFVATAGQDGQTKIWDLRGDKPTHRSVLVRAKSWVMNAAFSPDDRQLATAAFDGKARVFEVTTGQQIPPYMQHEDFVQCVQWSPDGRYILTAGLDFTARLWLSKEHQPVDNISILRHSDRVIYAGFDRYGERIVTSCEDGTIRIHDFAQRALIPTSDTYSEDGGRLMRVHAGTIEIRDAVTGEMISTNLLFESPPQTVRLNSDGRFVAALSITREGDKAVTKKVQVRDVSSGRALGVDLEVSNAISDTELSGNGSYLIAFGPGCFQIWDTVKAIAIASQTESREMTNTPVFSADSSRFATWAKQTAKVWETASGKQVFAPLECEHPIRCLRFSPNGQWIAACTADQSFAHCPANVWNAKTGQKSLSVQQTDGILWNSFDPASKRLATASEDKTAVIWEIASGRRLTARLRHAEPIRVCVFNRDGDWLLTASQDRSARIWDAQSGEALIPPLRHFAPLTSARFVAGDRAVLLQDLQGNECLWNLPIANESPSDLQSFAYLYSGGDITVPGASAPRQESLKQTWERLVKAFPSNFKLSEEELVNWHLFETDKCESEDDWKAAIFHLERLVSLRTNDKKLRERLNSDRQKLENNATVRAN